MHIETIALVISIAGLILSFFAVGFLPSLAMFIFNIKLFFDKRNIAAIRCLAISFAGIVLPVIMYVNVYGLSLPEKDPDMPIVMKILYENYANLGLVKDRDDAKDSYVVTTFEDKKEDLVIYGAEDVDTKEYPDENEPQEVYVSQEDGGFEDIQETGVKPLFAEEYAEKKELEEGASDDDMPSYGGLPVGTLLIARYFREDDHNCNPVLVLQNVTGEDCRYECLFTARDEDGNELAYSSKTVEVVRDKSIFVFEGRFDKNELGGRLPDMYEFAVSKRKPYESNMADKVHVYTRADGSSVVLTAENTSDKKIKVDAYVLLFDGAELVDCIWMIPQNTDEVCLEPYTMASIQGNAYYRFDRAETYYTAYEAVGE